MLFPGSCIKACRLTGRHILAMEGDTDIFNDVLKPMELPEIPKPFLDVHPVTETSDMDVEKQAELQAPDPAPTNPYLAKRRLKKNATQ